MCRAIHVLVPIIHTRTTYLLGVCRYVPYFIRTSMQNCTSLILPNEIARPASITIAVTKAPFHSFAPLHCDRLTDGLHQIYTCI